jgi:hypothetical protein
MPLNVVDVNSVVVKLKFTGLPNATKENSNAFFADTQRHELVAGRVKMYVPGVQVSFP